MWMFLDRILVSSDNYELLLFFSIVVFKVTVEEHKNKKLSKWKNWILQSKLSDGNQVYNSIYHYSLVRFR